MTPVADFEMRCYTLQWGKQSYTVLGKKQEKLSSLTLITTSEMMTFNE